MLLFRSTINTDFELYGKSETKKPLHGIDAFDCNVSYQSDQLQHSINEEGCSRVSLASILRDLCLLLNP